jgi:hypothetical protein
MRVHPTLEFSARVIRRQLSRLESVILEFPFEFSKLLLDQQVTRIARERDRNEVNPTHATQIALEFEKQLVGPWVPIALIRHAEHHRKLLSRRPRKRLCDDNYTYPLTTIKITH